MEFQKETYKLNNGIEIPKVAFGTWQITGEEATTSTLDALRFGYIHIDTALAYGNESKIKKALEIAKKELNINREDIFITSKLPAEIKGYEETIKAFNETISNLGVDYLDLYLIHAPRPWDKMWDASLNYDKENLDSYKAMIELYKQGKIRAIGVSNFSVKDMENLINNTDVVPTVNQVYYHPGCRRFDLEEYCKEKNILIEAYSPFATGRIFKCEELKEIANKYNVSVARLAVKWCLQRNTLPLPKSVHADRIKSNIELDFTISNEDLDKIDNVKF